MMKRTFIVATVVALVTSSAMAASLIMVPPVGTNTTSDVRGLTPDGKYAVGVSGAAYWWQVGVGLPATFNTPTWGNFPTVGAIDYYRSSGGSQRLVAHGLSAGWSATVWSGDGGATWRQGVRSSNTGQAPGIGTCNTMRATPSGDAWFTQWGSDANGTNLYVEKDGSDPPALIARDAKGTTQKSSTAGVSGTGLAVGRRKGDGTNYWNYKLQYVGTGTPAAAYFAGLRGDNFGEAWSVSTNGTKIFGLSPVTGGRTGNWPYAYTVGGSIVELATLPGTAGSVTNALPYGACDNGNWAAGMDYLGVEKAVVWKVTTNEVIDLTQYASDNGVLDGFVRLSRAYSVSRVAGGVVVSGVGVWSPDGGVTNYNRGFVLTMAPEPATMAFLALGGLALLRRRR